MKRMLLLLAALRFFTASANDGDSVTHYHLPDSVKAVSFYASLNMNGAGSKDKITTGIRTDAVSLVFASHKGSHTFRFSYPAGSAVVAKGLDVRIKKPGHIDFAFNMNPADTVKLMIAMAADSAGNFSLYSGYVWLHAIQKWKLIGTCKIEGRWNTLQELAGTTSKAAKSKAMISYNQVWCQRSNGSWKMLGEGENKPPVINLAGHADSAAVQAAEIKQIGEAIAAGTNSAKTASDGVYYEIIKEGTGRFVAVTDTVTVHYKGYLFSDGLVFDQTKEKPATFPLKRLIRGWQLGVPNCRVGGKIKLVIPSALAYSARTRAAKIPPNSILVFEIEVLEAKAGN